MRHNKLWYRVADLVGTAFTPSHVRYNPLIFVGLDVKRPNDKPDGTIGSTEQDGAPPPEAIEQKGDLLIRELWNNVTNSVHDMHVVNTDAKTHMVKTPEKCLQEAERGEMWVYMEACLQQRRHFSPFVASVDGFLGVEVTVTLKRLASRLATK